MRGPTLSCHAHLRPESQALVLDPWRGENPEWIWAQVKENPSKISQLKDAGAGGRRAVQAFRTSEAAD